MTDIRYVPLIVVRQIQGDPAGWTTADFEVWLQTSDAYLAVLADISSQFPDLPSSSNTYPKG